MKNTKIIIKTKSKSYPIFFGKKILTLSLDDFYYNKNQRILFNSFIKIIRNNRKFKYAKFSYRRYSFDAITSKIIEVHPLDWEIAMSVPSERFYSMDKRRLPSKVIWKKTDQRVKRNK